MANELFAFEHRCHSWDYLAIEVRFLDVPAGTRFEGFFDELVAPIFAKTGGLGLAYFGNLSSGLNPVQAGYSNVKQNKIGLQLLSLLAASKPSAASPATSTCGIPLMIPRITCHHSVKSSTMSTRTTDSSIDPEPSE